MQKEQVLQIIREHKQELAEKYHVKKVGIFGSVARNTAGPDSDIDIVVEMEPNLLLQAEL
jgi:predicted nucleotidyltransferase